MRETHDFPAVRRVFRSWWSTTSARESKRWRRPCDFTQVRTGGDLRSLLQEEYEALPQATGPDDEQRYSAMARILDAIRSDVRAFEDARADPPWPELVGSVVLLDASMRLAGIAIDRGDLRATRRALLAGIARDEGPGYDEVRPGSVLVLAHPEQPLPDVVVSEPLRRWSELLFVYDRFREGISIGSPDACSHRSNHGSSHDSAGTTTTRFSHLPWLSGRFVETSMTTGCSTRSTFSRRAEVSLRTPRWRS